MNFTNYRKFYEESKYKNVMSENDYLSYKDSNLFYLLNKKSSFKTENKFRTICRHYYALNIALYCRTFNNFFSGKGKNFIVICYGNEYFESINKCLLSVDESKIIKRMCQYSENIHEIYCLKKTI